MSNQITIRPTQKQHEAWEALRTKSEVFFGGGAGGGKSWWLCETRLVNCYLHPGYKSFIGREELKRLMQSTYVTWNKVCNFHGIPKEDWKLNGKYNYIEFKNGSRIDLLDLKMLPSDPLYERFGSLEYTDGAIEEAGEVNYMAYDVLQSRIGRHLNKEKGIKPTLAITGNPKKNWTYKTFYKRFKDGTLPIDSAFIQSLYTDNEYTAESYGEQLAKINDKATKQRLMYGNWEYDDDPTTLIDFDSIIDLYTNKVDKGEKYLVADIARYGRDKSVVTCWKGLECYKIEVYEKQGLDITTENIKKLLEDEAIPYSHAIIDDDGVGGGVVDNLRGVKGFVNNAVAIEEREDGAKIEVKDGKLIELKPNYQNLKTQCYYKLAEAINKHEMSVKTEDEKIKGLLEEELEQVKTKDADKDGKLKIIGKDEIKELIGRSPDFADNLMMRMFFTIQPMVSIERPQYNININRYG